MCYNTNSNYRKIPTKTHRSNWQCHLRPLRLGRCRSHLNSIVSPKELLSEVIADVMFMLYALSAILMQCRNREDVEVAEREIAI